MAATSSLALFRGLQTSAVATDLAWVFPGQGSQEVGMGRDLIRASPVARDLFQQADAFLGRGLSRLCFQGPEEELRQTVNAQPAILMVSLACLAAALESAPLARRPAFVAGHSLGEYTALVAATALDFEEALFLVRQRGRLMEEASQRDPGTMAAVMGLDEKQLNDICGRSGAEICNRNSPRQAVIGGPPEAMATAVELATAVGAKVVALNVSGAFHTSLMAPAATEFARAIDRASVRDPRIPVVANATARPLTTAEDVRVELKAQLTRPVLWQQSVEEMAAAGVSTFVEIGPGRVLSGLIKRTAEGARTLSVNGLSTIRTLSNERPRR